MPERTQESPGVGHYFHSTTDKSALAVVSISGGTPRTTGRRFPFMANDV